MEGDSASWTRTPLRDECRKVWLLGDLCGFLGLERKEDCLEDCASLVFESPRKTRYDVEWDAGTSAAVKEGIDRHEFLRGYSYER